MSALEKAVRNACDRMGVGIVQVPRSQRRGRWKEGPTASAGLEPVNRMIWLDPKYDANEDAWLWVLHELEHLVFWRDDDPMMEKTPEYMMMPFGVGSLAAGGIRSSVYWRSTFNYETAIFDCSVGDKMFYRVSDWKHPMRSAWSRRAKAMLIDACVLNEDGLPTWKMPDWSKIDTEQF